jgi:hypothetical protein
MYTSIIVLLDSADEEVIEGAMPMKRICPLVFTSSRRRERRVGI